MNPDSQRQVAAQPLMGTGDDQVGSRYGVCCATMAQGLCRISNEEIQRPIIMQCPGDFVDRQFDAAVADGRQKQTVTPTSVKGVGNVSDQRFRIQLITNQRAP